MTQFDKIKTMSIEEMAELLHNLTIDLEGCGHCPATKFCDKHLRKWGCSTRMFIEWLKSEVDTECQT